MPVPGLNCAGALRALAAEVGDVHLCPCVPVCLQTGNAGRAPLSAKKARRLPPGKAAAITGTSSNRLGAVGDASGGCALEGIWIGSGTCYITYNVI